MTEDDIKRWGQVIGQQVRIPIGLAVIVGAATGWLGVLALDDLQQIAALNARVHWSLYVILPLALLATLREPHDDVPLPYEPAVGLFGSLIGNLLYFLITLYIPFVFGGRDFAALRDLQLAALTWAQMGGLVVVTTVAAIAVGRWKITRG